ncbi:Protein of unknown function [Bacillus cereus]|nr:Protein of unknown function [Bacillus cereus]
MSVLIVSIPCIKQFIE